MTEQKQHQNLSQPRDGGYTIIESLVAMIVVSVLMIAIAPVMAFSVATRVQARRVELATQAARTYIDALRTGAIPNPATTPTPATAPTPGFPNSFTGSVTQTNPSVPSNKSDTNLYCIDLDGQNCATRSNSSNRAFYVQGAWQNTSNPAPTDPTTTGYPLLVRVYRGDAAFGSLTAGQQSVANSGIGDPKAPLVVMQTEIPPTTTGGSSAYRSLCTRTTGCSK